MAKERVIPETVQGIGATNATDQRTDGHCRGCRRVVECSPVIFVVAEQESSNSEWVAGTYQKTTFAYRLLRTEAAALCHTCRRSGYFRRLKYMARRIAARLAPLTAIGGFWTWVFLKDAFLPSHPSGRLLLFAVSFFVCLGLGQSTLRTMGYFWECVFRFDATVEESAMELLG